MKQDELFPLKATISQHYKNVLTLLEQSISMQKKKKALIAELALCDELGNDKIEEEIDFLTNYIRTLQDQAVVIINENNVKNIPTLEEIERTIK
jgi:hypothetical protein